MGVCVHITTFLALGLLFGLSVADRAPGLFYCSHGLNFEMLFSSLTPKSQKCPGLPAIMVSRNLCPLPPPLLDVFLNLAFTSVNSCFKETLLGLEDVAQLVECLSGMHKTLGFI